jgi:ADP-ribose pyrophosphatase YjhB (NUDIX family)
MGERGGRSLSTDDGAARYAPGSDPFEHPLVTVDLVVFTIRDHSLQLLLVERGEEPFKGAWALPGGFVRDRESLDEAARRELEEETGVRDIYLEQLYTFGEPNRDPRARVITVAYFAIIASGRRALRASADAADAQWFAVSALPPLAFDHDRIAEYAIERLRNKLEYTTVGFQLLPRDFTLTELQQAYEVILDKALDKRNFRKKMLSLGVVQPTGDTKMNGVHRPARLYRFSEARFMKLRDKGILFPF